MSQSTPPTPSLPRVWYVDWRRSANVESLLDSAYLSLSPKNSDHLQAMLLAAHVCRAPFARLPDTAAKCLLLRDSRMLGVALIALQLTDFSGDSAKEVSAKIHLTSAKLAIRGIAPPNEVDLIGAARCTALTRAWIKKLTLITQGKIHV